MGRARGSPTRDRFRRRPRRESSPPLRIRGKDAPHPSGTSVASAGFMRAQNFLGPVAFLALLAPGCGAPASEKVGNSGEDVTSGDIYNFGTLAHSGSCMDALAGGTADGTQIQEYTCNGTGAQSFELRSA